MQEATRHPFLRSSPDEAGIDGIRRGSFSDFLIADTFNQKLLWIAGIFIVGQFIIFKMLYPHAGFIDYDSYSYLEAADANDSISLYPIGYAKILRLFSVFSTSDTALVAFQYLAIQITAVWLLFSLVFFYSPSRFAKCMMFIVTICNPTFLFVSNYILSDALFLSVSLAWFTSLIWILLRPTVLLIILQISLLFLAFIVRYNALYYPIITTAVIIFSAQSLRKKLVSIGATYLTIGLFIIFTAGQYKELTGIRQFNPFSGWQMANNALYAYYHVDSASRRICPPQFISLNSVVCKYFDTTKNDPAEFSRATTLFMWNDGLPLRQFMMQKFRQDLSASEFTRWAAMGPLYSKYGYYIAKRFPIVYCRFYLYPNMANYFWPPVWHLNAYNGGTNTVEPIARRWFRYKSDKVKSAFKDFKVKSLDFIPAFTCMMNGLFIFEVIYLVGLRTFRRYTQLSKIIMLAALFWMLNFLFSVFAAFIQLRSQLFGSTVIFFFAILCFDIIYNTTYKKIPRVSE